MAERVRASARKVVPARFMEPRVIFCLVVGALCLFGLVMIYSASSVTMLKQTGDACYLLKRQAALMMQNFLKSISPSEKYLWQSDAVLRRMMGLANSDGCSWMPLTSIQRTAPLVSTPKRRV